MRALTMAVLASLAVAATAYAAGPCCGSAKAEPAKAKVKVESCCTGVGYVCAACKTCVQEAGKCATCKTDRVAMKRLAVKGDQCVMCPCGADCNCKLSEDGKTCTCGKDVVTVAATCKGKTAVKMEVKAE